jgi:hypothetical protein
VLVHFWYAAILLLAVVGGLVFLAVTYAAGAAKYWSAFVAAARGFASLVQRVRRILSNLAQRAEVPLWQARPASRYNAAASGGDSRPHSPAGLAQAVRAPRRHGHPGTGPGDRDTRDSARGGWPHPYHARQHAPRMQQQLSLNRRTAPPDETGLHGNRRACRSLG